MDKDIRTGIAPYETVPLRIVEPLHLPLHLFPDLAADGEMKMWALASSYTRGGLQGLKQKLKFLKVPRHQFTLRLQAAKVSGSGKVVIPQSATNPRQSLRPFFGLFAVFQHHLMTGRLAVAPHCSVCVIL